MKVDIKSVIRDYSLRNYVVNVQSLNRKNDLILIMTPEKQDKTLELSKHMSADSTPANNENDISSKISKV